MEPIYVTGHRNPDTDSIVSAMAYAALRNALGDREFVPARLGHISDETRLVLGRFGFEPPIRIQTMRTQVRDLDYDTPPALSGAVTVSRAWTALQNNRSIPAIPVTNDNGELYGMLSPSEIASYDMRTLSDSRVDRIPVFNLLSVLDGKIINEDGYLADTISGEVQHRAAAGQRKSPVPRPGRHRHRRRTAGDGAPRARAAGQLPDRLPGGAAGGAAPACRRTPASSPRRSTPTRPPGWSITPSRSPASAGRRILRPSI